MTDIRCILEMGTGTDLHGGDYTKAATRAVRDALQHSSLSFIRVLGLDTKTLPVRVTIGVQQPERIDTAIIAREFPIGAVTIEAVKGGMDVPDRANNDMAVVASAAIQVFMP